MQEKNKFMKIEYEYEKESDSAPGQPVSVDYKPKVRVPKDLPKECQKHLEEYFADRPIAEMQAASQFLSSMYYYVKDKAAQDITLEDFEKAKKGDDDSDTKY